MAWVLPRAPTVPPPLHDRTTAALAHGSSCSLILAASLFFLSCTHGWTHSSLHCCEEQSLVVNVERKQRSCLSQKMSRPSCPSSYLYSHAVFSMERYTYLALSPLLHVQLLTYILLLSHFAPNIVRATFRLHGATLCNGRDLITLNCHRSRGESK